ncbi:GGDEF domain-containing protein [Sulfurimonas autotrophica]|uniref:diguanylate cyclase n=1 Tax=Sulfurimonas autotrophica (strain ATCC BAA-671 / DSM 16294 / JCM 11897 / OK10) TaxID=563040 RepID=E0UUD2_SULAO|nr:GGDEF domain-containing protein [Sulfurimonas autotrophica]ADN09507.1 diguanylate cyclase [Sulfurimonas autotrophica DSM 16294]
MQENKKILEIISNDAKSSIEQLSVVTPSMYASIFSELAKKHNIDIEDEENLSKEIVTNECNKLTALQKETSKNVQTLSESTNRAIDAIENKDEKVLNQVLKETQALRYEIEKLKESVYQDELTHTYNRKWLHDTYLNKEGENFVNNGTLAIIDLNYFKQINDTHGHIIGDKVLIFVTNELKKLKLPVIRYGGDEFIIIFKNNITKEKALSFLNKIREEVLSKKLKAHNDTFRVSFSFGVSEFHENDELAQVIESADKDMYNDKIKIKKKVTGI